MINDNFEDELSGILFSILYLVRDTKNHGLKETSSCLTNALQSLLNDCSRRGQSIAEFECIISLCLSSMNLYESEIKTLTQALEKMSDMKTGSEKGDSCSEQL